MARVNADEDGEKPLDPAVERLRRKLVRFVVINLSLLFLALMLVIAALVYKSRTRPHAAPAQTGDIPAPAGDPATGDIVLPAGARIASQSLSGDRILIDAQLADGSHVLFVYDIAARRMAGRFTISNQ